MKNVFGISRDKLMDGDHPRNYPNFDDPGSSSTRRQSRCLARLNYDKSVSGEKHLETLSAAPTDQRTNLEGGFDIRLKRA
jgi:hypothetical protein